MMLFITSVQLRCVASFICPHSWWFLRVTRLSRGGGQHWLRCEEEPAGFTSIFWNGVISEHWGVGWWFTKNAPRTLPPQSALTPLMLSANGLLWQRAASNTPAFTGQIPPIIGHSQPAHSSWVFIPVFLVVSWGNTVQNINFPRVNVSLCGCKTI